MRSIDDYTTFFILYDWTTNAILAIPLKDAPDESMVDTSKKSIEYLEEQGFKSIFNVIDNVASKVTRAYLKETKIVIQLVKPHDHRANSSERAIQIFRNHFMSRLCI